MTVALDNNSTYYARTNFGKNGSHISGTVTLSTAGTGRIVLVHIASELDLNSNYSTVSTVTASGLTFAKLASFTSADVSHPHAGQDTQQAFEVWWAYASAQLSGTVITVTMSQIPDVCEVYAFAVSGQNSNTNPFDSGSVANASNATSTGSQVSVTGFSTSQASDMIIQMGSSDAFVTPAAPGTGWTQLQHQFNYQDSWDNYCNLFGQYKNVSSTQSNITCSFDSTSTQYWNSIVYAITASGSGPIVAPWIANLFGV